MDIDESSGVPCELFTVTGTSPLTKVDTKAHTPLIPVTLTCHAPADVADVTPAPATTGEPVVDTQFVPSAVTAKDTVALNVPVPI